MIKAKTALSLAFKLLQHAAGMQLTKTFVAVEQWRVNDESQAQHGMTEVQLNRLDAFVFF